MADNIWDLYYAILDEHDHHYCILKSLGLGVMWDRCTEGHLFIALDPLQVMRRAFWNQNIYKCHACGKTFLNNYNDDKCIHCGCGGLIGYLPLIHTEAGSSLSMADYNVNFEKHYLRTSPIAENDRIEIESADLIKLDEEAIMKGVEFGGMYNCLKYLEQCGIKDVSCVISGLTGRTRFYAPFESLVGFLISSVYSNECINCKELFLSKSPADCCQMCGNPELISHKIDSKFNKNLLKETPEPPIKTDGE